MTHAATIKARLIIIILAILWAVAPIVPTPSVLAAQRNIVIIITDDHNIDSLPVMRNLMSYPEGSWIKFNNAYANNSICCPARATLLTGQYSHHTGVVDNQSGHLLDDTNTLPVWLDNAGYKTALIGKYLNRFPFHSAAYVPPGWDHFQVLGIPDDADSRLQMAVNFIQSTTSSFFLYLAFNEPHHPAVPPKRYENASVYIPPVPPNFNEADIADKPFWVHTLPRLTISSVRQERLTSQRALLAVDDAVQIIIETLKVKGLLDQTLIIFLGDNGFSWGSHRFVRKPCLYEECSRIPLLIRYPGVAANREENRLVSNVDLAPTIAEYAGVTPGLPQDGTSLISLLEDRAIAWKDEILLESFDVYDRAERSFFGIVVPGWKYGVFATGDKELYDLTADPYELQNLADNANFSEVQAQLAERLQRYLQTPPPETALLFLPQLRQ